MQDLDTRTRLCGNALHLSSERVLLHRFIFDRSPMPDNEGARRHTRKVYEEHQKINVEWYQALQIDKIGKSFGESFTTPLSSPSGPPSMKLNSHDSHLISFSLLFS
jgi:hypothetical protein